MNSTSLIKGFRGKKLYSQEKVAELLGISRQSYKVIFVSSKEKISRISKLLEEGVISDEEYVKIISILTNTGNNESVKELTPAQKCYEDYIEQLLLKGIKVRVLYNFHSLMYLW